MTKRLSPELNVEELNVESVYATLKALEEAELFASGLSSPARLKRKLRKGKQENEEAAEKSISAVSAMARGAESPKRVDQGLQFA